MSDLPKNCEVSKDKIPKGYSYVVQTSDILDALAPKVLERPVYIRYVNEIPAKDSSYRSLFSVTYRGDKNQLFRDFPSPDSDEISERDIIIAQVIFSVFPIEAAVRKFARQSCQQKYLGMANKWLLERWNQQVLAAEDKRLQVDWYKYKWEELSKMRVREDRGYRYGLSDRKMQSNLLLEENAENWDGTPAKHPSEGQK